MADPSPLLVQFPQVVSPPAVENIPIGSEPVRMSCIFTLSPRPLTVSPFSVRAVSLVMLTFSECRSSALLPTITPLTLCHGPMPMRSRALMPASPPGIVVLRYARQLVCVEPAALARAAQCASAPSSPPRSAPFPLPTLDTKNVMLATWACTEAVAASATIAEAASNEKLSFLFIRSSLYNPFRTANRPRRNARASSRPVTRRRMGAVKHRVSARLYRRHPLGWRLARLRWLAGQSHSC